MAPRTRNSALHLAAGPPKAPDEVELGSVSGVFGVRGELRLFLHNRESDWLAQRRTVTLGMPDGARYTASLDARPGAGGRVLGRVEGVDTAELAQLLVGATILVPRDVLPPPGEAEFYVSDLIGCAVREGGVVVGKVVAVHQGEVDILEIDAGGELAYLPLLKERVLAIGRGGVDLVPGALVRGEV